MAEAFGLLGHHFSRFCNDILVFLLGKEKENREERSYYLACSSYLENCNMPCMHHSVITGYTDSVKFELLD